MSVIPYEADRIVERERLVTVAQEAWERSRGLTITVAGDGVPSELQLHLLEGRWEQARQLAIEFLLAPWSVLVHEAIVTLGILAREQGDPHRAWERVIELLPQGPATDPGDRYFPSAIAAIALAAELALDAHDLPMAMRWIETHDHWLDWSEARLWKADNQLLWARCHEVSGDLARARRHAEQAHTLASDPRQPLRLVAAWRLLGSLDRQEGYHDRAAAHLDQSLSLAGACAAPFERVLSLLALAQLRVATCEHGVAQALLDDARMICGLLGARPTLERIAAIETRLHMTTAAGHPDGLTERELEVLRLIASGRSNRAIAEALFLSPRTVERHIANLYLKLDVHTKAEAIIYAQRHHLA
jgi:ATP/maltotriose-dependent transcriptional regulator MalT